MGAGASSEKVARIDSKALVKVGEVVGGSPGSSPRAGEGQGGWGPGPGSSRLGAVRGGEGEMSYLSLSSLDAREGLRASNSAATALFDRQQTFRLTGSSDMNEEILTKRPRIKKTKIICTLGPTCKDADTLAAMLRSGMSVARFNFSHGTHEYHQETLDLLNKVKQETGLNCGILLDTKGPEIRTGFLKPETGGTIQLEMGKTIVLTNDYEYKGDAEKLALSYKSLPLHVRPGQKILLADGSVTLEVQQCEPDKGQVIAKILNNAKIGERKNCNLPGVVVDLPTITDKDKEDLILWGVKNQVDFIAASFVRKGSDVKYIREVLGDAGANIKIVSKIENQEGLENFHDILYESDGIMIARGDLGMEIPLEKMFLAQKVMCLKCNLAGKFVVTATQMLESMTSAPRPTRAESTDVANAVIDGSDAVMLSGETANGRFPVEAVRTMSNICVEAEACLDYKQLFKNTYERISDDPSSFEGIATAAVRLSSSIGVCCIMVLARTGSTARLIAKYRPEVPVIVVIPAPSASDTAQAEAIGRGCLLTRGLFPIVVTRGSTNGAIGIDNNSATAYFAEAMERVDGRVTKSGAVMASKGDLVIQVHQHGNGLELVTTAIS